MSEREGERPAAMPVRYSAFISYNHRDRAWASWLHRQLEGYRLPRALVGRDSPLGPLTRRLPPVFQDREELAASTDLAASVLQALGESASLIVICSARGAASQWVNEEIRSFRALGRGDRIQCLIVPEHDAPRNAPPLPGDAIFPPALLESGVEPLAADARPAGDGPSAALLKLLAGLLAVNYDELRQRQQARRNRQLMLIAGVSAIGFVMMSGLSVFALVSRAEAVRQRDVARQKTITAQRTTDFVKGLFAMSDPSEAKGAKITAQQILDRGAAQISSGLQQEPNVKADLMATLSEVYLGLGAFRRADQLISRSMSLPTDDRLIRARQFAVMGVAQAQQSDYGNALKSFDRALALTAATGERDDPGLVTQILAGRAETLAWLDRFDPAGKDIQRAIRIDSQQSGRRSPAVARDLEIAALADFLANRLPEARTQYEQALAIRLAAQGPLHPRVSVDRYELGSIAYQQRDPAAAERYWRQSLAADEQVLGPNHPDLGLTLNNLALLFIEQRRFGEALPLAERSIKLNLVEHDETYDDFAFLFYNLARAQRGLGRWAAAEAGFQRALKAADLHKSRMTAPILTDLAEIKCLRGETAQAWPLLDRATPLMRAAYPDEAWRQAWVVNARGFCLLRAGRRAAAADALQSSAAAIRAHWQPGTMYGSILTARLAELASPGRSTSAAAPQ